MPQTKAERVYLALREDITAGRLPAGAPLDEVALAEVHGVSRTPVREALRRLTSDGLAATGARRQVRVVELSDARRHELTVIRCALEAAAVPWACERVTPEDLDELRLSLFKQHRLAVSGAIGDFLAADEQFHRRLVQTARMDTLARLVDQLGPVIRLTRLGVPTSIDHVRVLVAEHERIATLLEERKSELLVTFLDNHIRNIGPRGPAGGGSQSLR
ncbi:MAG: GntR family transcriptional regulator [Tetrasphaera sp.]